MGLFDQFPYTNFHELNLDWLLKMVKELNTKIENFVALNTIKYADPIQWNITTQYKANTVVVDPQSGTAYISSKAVPSGVALTNTDYWSVIFTLDIISANKNLTLRDDGSNVLATFASNAGDWLLWNGTLYKVSQNIAVNEAYVAGYNLDRYTVELYIKDLANTVGDLDDLATTDKSSIVNAINEIVNALSALINAVGDLDDLSTTDKSSIVNAINEIQAAIFDNSKLGHIIYENKNLTSNTTIDDYCYSLNESSIASSAEIVNNGTIDKLSINSTHNPAIYNNKDIRNSVIKTAANIAVNMDKTAEDIIVSNSRITGGHYGVLVNNAANIDSCQINNNIIKSTEGDSVEINTPANGATQDAKNISVSNNILDVEDLTSTLSGSGAALGFATAINAVAVGNISKHSRFDSLHIEDNTNKIIVSNNIFDNSKANGSYLALGYTRDSNRDNDGRPAIITNNYFKHRTDDVTGIGLNKIYDAHTDDSFGTYTNNIIEGYNIGIAMGGGTSIAHKINIDGCIVIGCNYGIALSVETMGTLTLIDCNKAISIDSGSSHIDKAVILGTDATNIFNLSGSTYTFTCDELNIFKKGTFNANTNYDMLKIPTKFRGTIEIKTNFQDRIYDVTDSTITQVNNFYSGGTVFALVENSGYYAIRTNNTYTGTVEVIAKGFYLLGA